MMVEWQESTKELLREAEGILAKLMRRRLIAEDKKLVESSGKVIAAVKNDGSSGVHNPDFVDELLSESVKRLKGTIDFRSR